MLTLACSSMQAPLASGLDRPVSTAAPNVVTGSAYELLWRSNASSSLDAARRESGDTPLVLLDGVRLESVERLRDLPAASVRQLRILSPRQASHRYGPVARFGAIEVRTR